MTIWAVEPLCSSCLGGELRGKDLGTEAASDGNDDAPCSLQGHHISRGVSNGLHEGSLCTPATLPIQPSRRVKVRLASPPCQEQGFGLQWAAKRLERQDHAGAMDDLRAALHSNCLQRFSTGYEDRQSYSNTPYISVVMISISICISTQVESF